MVFVRALMATVVGLAAAAADWPSPEEVAKSESYLAPYADSLLAYRDNPVAKDFITLTNLVDILPTFLIDLFIPFILPGANITIPINAEIDFKIPVGIIPLPGKIEILDLTIADLDQFTALKPLKILNGGLYTWGGDIELDSLTVILTGRLEVLGQTVDAEFKVALVKPVMTYALLFAFDRVNICEYFGTVMESSLACAVAPVFFDQMGDVSGINMTSFKLNIDDFDFAVTVTGLGDEIDRTIEQELEAVIDAAKPDIINSINTTISEGVRDAINNEVASSLPQFQAENPCELKTITDDTNLDYILDVSRICVANNGGYVLKYNFNDCPAETVSDMTPGFPIDQKKCYDVKQLLPYAEEGEIIRVTVEAVAGVWKLLNPAMRYKPSSNAAGFVCTGTTLDYHCDFNSLAPIDPAIPAPVSRVCVLNNAGFDLYFQVTDTVTGNKTPRSGTYPINQQQCMDLNRAEGVEEGHIMKIDVQAIAGYKEPTDRVVEYQANGLTANYECTGTTLNFKCKLIV